MSVSAHIAAQRTDHAVPHAVSCRALGVAPSTFYKWHNRPPTPAKRRRAELDVEVRACFDASGGTYGSPRVRAALRRSGLKVSKKTVESSMARQGLQGRAPKRRRGLTRPDKRAEPVPDLLRRDFTAGGVNEKWVGDFKQIDTGEGPVFLATVEDLFSRRMLGFAQSDRHPTAQLATDAINMAAAVRGGDDPLNLVKLPPTRSRRPAPSSRSPNRWDASAARSTTPPPSRSSRRSSTS